VFCFCSIIPKLFRHECLYHKLGFFSIRPASESVYSQAIFGPKSTKNGFKVRNTGCQYRADFKS
jgi:hypothetical protein